MNGKCNFSQSSDALAKNDSEVVFLDLDSGQEIGAVLPIAQMATTPVATMHKTKKYRILVVDDDPLVLFIISNGLKQAGYEPVIARSGQEALQLIAENSLDLAMLDISMPEMSGIDLAKYLREKTSIPIMFLSSHAESDIVRQATENGAVAYLVKPLHFTQIVPAIEAALASAAEIGSLRLAQAVLTDALTAGRETNTATGVLMERYHLNRQQAFDILRSYARSLRCKINRIATEILKAENVTDPIPAPRKNRVDKQRILQHLGTYSRPSDQD